MYQNFDRLGLILAFADYRTTCLIPAVSSFNITTLCSVVFKGLQYYYISVFLSRGFLKTLYAFTPYGLTPCHWFPFLSVRIKREPAGTTNFILVLVFAYLPSEVNVYRLMTA